MVLTARTDNQSMSTPTSRSQSSASVPGNPGSGTTPEQPQVPSVSEVIAGAPAPSQESTVTDPAPSAPNLPKAEQAEIAQNDADSPSVKDESAKLAGEAARKDAQARLDNPNVPVIREGDPRVGGEHFR